MMIKNVAGQSDILDEKHDTKPMMTFTCPRTKCMTLSRLDQDLNDNEGIKIQFSWATDEWSIEQVREDDDIHGYPLIAISSMCPECKWIVRYNYSMVDVFQYLINLMGKFDGHRRVTGLHNE